jgi:asparagine synthase (glutamine-hydrolysing)
MCGIFALSCRNKQDNNEEIEKAFNTLQKRGPEFSSFHVSSEYIYGFARLSINDPSALGNQPFVHNNVIVMCNGEIYNHKQLEKKYDIVCKSKSDCECLGELYLKIGFNLFTELDGVFAIVVIDGDKMYFARDRIGVRPLFYGCTNSGNVVVASTATALLGYCKRITHLKPGIMVYDKATDTFGRTEYTFDTSSWDLSYDPYSEIRNRLTYAVQKRLMSDRPLCCMLSGGVDSSLIVSILCKLIGPENVRTFSIGMEGSNDLKYAEKVAKYLGTTHESVVFTPARGLEVIPHVIKDIESYDITTIRASVSMWLLSKYIKEHTDNKVILSGEGADELFMGYLYFHYAPSAQASEEESLRLIRELYLYDVLRADRCVSSHGLELRVPFLDKKVIDLCLSMPPNLKIPTDGVEKYVLRKSFEGYLPDDVLWRRKDGMSDGCSSLQKSWYEYIQEYVDTQICDDEFLSAGDGFPSKEAYYYYKIYSSMFPCYIPKYDYWLPKWVDCHGDPSGRKLNVFKNK